MSNELIKLGPLAGFLLAVGYCVWPHVAPPPHQAAPTPALPKIDSSLLTPDFAAPSSRDPFRQHDDPARLAARPGPAEAGRGPGVAGRSNTPARAGALRPSSPGFELGATLVSEGRRAAIIDGRVYRQGEPLERPEGAPGGASWTVARIEPGRVILGRENHRDSLVLELPDRLAALMAETSPAALESFNDRSVRVGMETLTEARAALAAAGVHLPAPDLIEQIARRSGGSLPEISMALLRLLVSPPPGPLPAGPALTASVEGSR
ncbi:hypothetical protein AB1L88_13635 [Tautonia sp. JC769]|uniref:hypothetical protein n=1 Tax=Tautonia sp. JC769 TaxID=3232135 RepID=UPI0034585FD3